MDLNTLLDVMERILDNSHAAILTTVDGEGRPHSRWMVPAVLRGRQGTLYAVTSPDFEKVKQINSHARVSWLVQSKALDEIVHVQGSAQVIDNPSLKSDVLEALGHNLTTFWTVNAGETELVVIETVIEAVQYIQPMKGERSQATA